MFLNSLLGENAALADVALQLIGEGAILPDTYVLDLDMIRENASKIAAEANTYGLKSYFMLKQLGRNPLVANSLADMGFCGAVCVDYREALVMARANVPIGHVGHLVQLPRNAIESVLRAHPDVVTVYSVEKAAELSDAAESLGIRQKVLLRVRSESDTTYPGQSAGFPLADLEKTVTQLERMPGIRIAGACSFPCFLYDKSVGDFVKQPNADTVITAARMLRDRGYDELQLNMPSGNCVHELGMVAKAGGTHIEPGHGLSGTTPYHADHNAAEKPAYVYVTEVSHNADNKSYCYGGGYYRRGHLVHAAVGNSLESAQLCNVSPLSDECIDYHLELEGSFSVSTSVLMCFRTQMFVTRSSIAVVEGIQHGKPELLGIWSPLGDRIA